MAAFKHQHLSRRKQNDSINRRAINDDTEESRKRKSLAKSFCDITYASILEKENENRPVLKPVGGA